MQPYTLLAGLVVRSPYDASNVCGLRHFITKSNHMTKLVSIDEERQKRIEPCVYCGEEQHKVPLACPRIAAVYICTETGRVECIEFREPLDVPTPPAAA
jgi:hypothetical protein